MSSPYIAPGGIVGQTIDRHIKKGGFILEDPFSIEDDHWAKDLS